MRTFAPRPLIGLLALALAGPASAEVWYGGQLGFGMNQRNDWNAAADTSSRLYSFTGALHLDSSFFSPGTLTLSGMADYRGYRADGGSASDGLNYGLRLGALGQTPVHLSAAATRTTVDFTGDSSGTRTGTTRVEGLSASAALVQQDLPFLLATVRSSNVTNRAIGGAPIKSDTTALSLEAAQAVDAANYRLTYDASWSNGDHAEANSRTQLVAFRVATALAASVTAKVDATYFVRTPTLDSALSPRIDTQTVSSWLQVGGTPEASGGGGYSYSSSLFQVPGQPARESIAHALAAYGSRQLTTELGLDLSAGASALQDRANQEEHRATGEQVGAGLRWARPGGQFSPNASLMAGIGAYQPHGAANTTAWNAGVGGGISRSVSTWLLAGSLNGSYDSNTGASAGTRRRFLGVATASGDPYGWSLVNMLNLGFALTDSPSFGSRRVIDARLSTQARRAGYTLQLNAGLTDDLSEALAPGSPPVGSVAPVDFNTQSRFVILSATMPTGGPLALSLTGRYVSFTSPGRGTQWESGAVLTASYAIGAFQLSLYDQLTQGGSATTSTGTQNLLFLSIARSFGR